MTRHFFTILTAVLLCNIGLASNCSKYHKKPMSTGNISYNSRSDSLDVLHYDIFLEVYDFNTKTISGNCEITLTPKMNNQTHVRFDLLSLTVDSIVYNNSSLSYNHNDTLLKVSLPAPINIGDTVKINIYYQGSPQKDPSGWGGFYFSGNQAFNLGVAFESIPHNFGRAWFPCFDNFVERSTYDISLKTADGKVGIANGLLVDEINMGGDTVLRHWSLKENIPTYLACIAVGDYETIHQSYSGLNGITPIELYSLAADTNKFKNSFIHLNDAMAAFEEAFGPYLWEKVGYTLVPFNGGAMEHATNIAYPKSSADGSLSDETLMAHELSHHWWGDLATCETAQEMWINEGMARYSEALFLEHVYGRKSYNKDMDDNHLFVIQKPHLSEGGFLALDDIPLEFTYGDHVYRKGADVAHTMRGYLGDSLFFSGLKQVLEEYKFNSISNEQFRDALTAATGIDMSPFFEGWVMNGGFPHFSLYSLNYEQIGGQYDITMWLQQRLRGAPNYFQDVPVEITFMDNNWNIHTEVVMVSGSGTYSELTIPIEPIFVSIDHNHLISDAITDEVYTINKAGLINSTPGYFELDVTDISDSALIRIEHNWVGPNDFHDPTAKYQLSTSRYWKISGLLPSTFSATGQIMYNGQNTTSGRLDGDLIGFSEDSLYLFYREAPTDEWQIYPYYTKDDLSNQTDMLGLIHLDSLLLGEYALGVANHEAIHSSIKEAETSSKIKLYPNPTSGTLNLELNMDIAKPLTLYLYNLKGQLMEQHLISASNSKQVIVSNLPNGIYLYRLDEEPLKMSNKLVIRR